MPAAWKLTSRFEFNKAVLSTGVTGGAGKARDDLEGRKFHVLQLAAITGRSAGYNRTTPKLSTIVAERVCS